MKAIHMIAILVALLLIVGCKPAAKEETAKPVATQPTQVSEPVAVENPETSVAASKDELSYEGSDPAIQRMITACKAGNVGVCTTLKTKYSIDMSPD